MNNIESKIEEIKEAALDRIKNAADLKSLENLKNAFLGRKGSVADLFNEMASLNADQKKKTGKLLNELKSLIENSINDKKESLKDFIGKPMAANDSFDPSIPGKKIKLGSKNIITQVMDDILDIFNSLGYLVARGPEIESEYYNFEALNIPSNHPSRDMWSTFYVGDKKLLRTHTSPVQIRYMEKNKPPFFAVFPGRVFRRDAFDLTHLPVFHQLEGLAVSKDLTFQDLKGTLKYFLKRLFGQNRKVRFRPSYFPFTEPSAEVDVECFICEGSGCRICKNTGWLEILGSGMVDPNVFKAVGYDPEEINGFAFGIGIERIAMLKYGIDDIRLFFENDIRFLKQF